MNQVVVADVVLAPAEVAARRSRPLAPGAAGIANTILCEHRGAIAGTLRIRPGVTLPPHSHHGMGHHVWVVSGRAFAFGRTMPAGSYWFVRPGNVHTLEGMAPDGCTLFYVDVPEA